MLPHLSWADAVSSLGLSVYTWDDPSTVLSAILQS